MNSTQKTELRSDSTVFRITKDSIPTELSPLPKVSESAANTDSIIQRLIDILKELSLRSTIVKSCKIELKYPNFSNRNSKKRISIALEYLKIWNKRLVDIVLPVKRPGDEIEEEIKIQKKDLTENEPLYKIEEPIQKKLEEKRRVYERKKVTDEKKNKVTSNETETRLIDENKENERVIKKEVLSNRAGILFLMIFCIFLLGIKLHNHELGLNTAEIPVQFKTSDEYVHFFQPCFLEEVFSEILSAINQRDMSKYSKINIKSVMQFQNFVSLIFTERTGFHQLKNSLRTEDLVLLIPKCHPSIFRKSFKLWTQYPDSILAFAEWSHEYKKMILKIRSCDSHILKASVEIFAFIINSCTTLIREFKMISSLEFTCLSQKIFNPATPPYLRNKENLVCIKSTLRWLYNESQVDVIINCCCFKEGIALIQGPPGTGKTNTIKGILSVIIHNFTDRVLICAPSNTAVDEIAARVLQDILFTDVPYSNKKLNLLRIGEKRSFNDIREFKKDFKEMPEIVQSIT